MYRPSPLPLGISILVLDLTIYYASLEAEIGAGMAILKKGRGN